MQYSEKNKKPQLTKSARYFNSIDDGHRSHRMTEAWNKQLSLHDDAWLKVLVEYNTDAGEMFPGFPPEQTLASAYRVAILDKELGFMTISGLLQDAILQICHRFKDLPAGMHDHLRQIIDALQSTSKLFDWMECHGCKALNPAG